MPDRVHLHQIDPELIPGARNAIDVCLRLKPQERITIITDTATREIAAALQNEVERVGSNYSLFVLENHARRPLAHMPENILDDLALSHHAPRLHRAGDPREMAVERVVGKSRDSVLDALPAPKKAGEGRSRSRRVSTAALSTAGAPPVITRADGSSASEESSAAER